MRRLLLLVLWLAAAAAQASEVDDSFRMEVEGILKAFERKKYEEVVAKIDAMPKEGESGAFLMNLQGAAYTKLKDYDAAKKAFERALELAPGMFAPTFNLGEILFLQRDYENALSWFMGMLANDPGNELLQFKVFMCQLLAEDREAAQRSLSRMKFPGDTPAWYYAKAAWEITRGNKGKASDYLDGARYIFPGKTEIYDETFSDLGFPRR